MTILLIAVLCGISYVPLVHAQFVEDSDTICVYYDKTIRFQYERITEDLELEKHPIEDTYRTPGEGAAIERRGLKGFYTCQGIPITGLDYKPLIEWPGVKKVENDRVVAFAMPNSNLRGSIDHLDCLHKLEYLDLSNNQLKGEVPFLQSPYLKILILSNNNFQGMFPAPLNLPSMETIAIDGNCLDLNSIDESRYQHLKVFDITKQNELPEEARIHVLPNGGKHLLKLIKKK